MTKITDLQEFNDFSNKFQSEHEMPYAFGIGLSFHESDKDDAVTIAHKWLSISIVDEEGKNGNWGTASVLMDALEMQISADSPTYLEFTKDEDGNEANEIIQNYFTAFEDDGKYHENIEALKSIYHLNQSNARGAVIFYQTKEIFQKQITNNADAHFRLASISRLKFKPNTICLDILFSVLPNLVWEDNGMVLTIESWNHEGGFLSGARVITDKIPLLTWGAPIPIGVRIANPNNVRLGAYLSPGTTIMHYGFVNFNAGTLGKSMVEGRISAGTTIDDGTDIGAGAGFLGTLSGGNSLKLSAGKDCLIGAMAECGVILGNNCVVATGTCFSQNTPIVEIVPVPGSNTFIEKSGKVKDYNGKDNLTYRRNSTTGRLEVIHKGNKEILNETLHSNQ